MERVDCVYVTASTYDARYTRTCVASIRYFYPQVPIRLLVGGRLQRGLVSELQRYWQVELADVPPGDYGWGFAKLEVLFGKAGERFLMLDSDTVLAGPVLDIWNESLAAFVVDEEEPSETEAKELYYNWEEMRSIDPSASRPRFLFNTGQWFGTAGALTRDDFSPWIEWSLPRKTCPPGQFRNGEQGLLNYVLNRKASAGALVVQRRKIMCWPGRSLNGLTAAAVSRHVAPPVVVHWAGMKKSLYRDLPGADLLSFFESFYYRKLPGAGLQRLFAICRHFFAHWLLHVRVTIKLRYRMLVSRASKREPCAP